MNLIWGLPVPLLAFGACVLLVAAGWQLGFEAGRNWVFRVIARQPNAQLQRQRDVYADEQRQKLSRR